MFAGVGAGRHADEAQRAGLGGDDGEADRPPRHRTAGQEVVAGGLLESREPGTEGGDGEQVGGDDCVVDPGEDHAEGVATVACRLIGVNARDSARRERRPLRAAARVIAHFGNGMEHVIGIDAGGTKTVCLLADEHGAILARARGEGANLQAVGELQVEKILHTVMARGDRRPAHRARGDLPGHRRRRSPERCCRRPQHHAAHRLQLAHR